MSKSQVKVRNMKRTDSSDLSSEVDDRSYSEDKQSSSRLLPDIPTRSIVGQGANGLISKATSVFGSMDSRAVKKNLSLVKHKAQDLISMGREQLASTYSTLSDDIKLRGMIADDKVKANPYSYAFGAAGIGFIVGRILSGKGKQDLDYLRSTRNRMNVGSMEETLNRKMKPNEAKSSDSNEVQAGEKKKGKLIYNENPACKIG